MVLWVILHTSLHLKKELATPCMKIPVGQEILRLNYHYLWNTHKKGLKLMRWSDMRLRIHIWHTPLSITEFWWKSLKLYEVGACSLESRQSWPAAIYQLRTLGMQVPSLSFRFSSVNGSIYITHFKWLLWELSEIIQGEHLAEYYFVITKLMPFLHLFNWPIHCSLCVICDSFILNNIQNKSCFVKFEWLWRSKKV